MSLTAQKQAHILAMLRKTFTGRSQQVKLTLRTGGGGTTTLTVPAVWKPVVDADPSLIASKRLAGHLGGDPDVQAVFLTADVTLPQLRSCILAELVTHGTGAEPAQKYTLVAVEPHGLLPGGDRFLTRWTRQH